MQGILEYWMARYWGYSGDTGHKSVEDRNQQPESRGIDRVD